MEFSDHEHLHTKIILVIITSLTAILVCLNVLSYRAYLDYLKSRNIVGTSETVWSAGFGGQLLLEVLLTLPHPNLACFGVQMHVYNSIINATYIQRLNEIMNLLQLAKLAVVIRFVMVTSSFYDCSAQRVCSMYGIKPTYAFVIRSFMRKFSFRVVAISFLTSLFIFAYALRVAERPLVSILPPDQLTFDSFGDSLWGVVITMTTVGYGDYFPRTIIGRCITLAMCIWGVFNTSLGVISINKYLQLSFLENKAFSTVRRLLARNDMKKDAMTLIGRVAELMRRGKRVSDHQVFELRKYVNTFKEGRRGYESLRDEASNLSEEFQRQSVFILSEIRDYAQQQRKLAELFGNLEKKIKYFFEDEM
eukprot:TRINITY_DN2884_c0_g2_i1.p1 TRINITY_DN2884_c0_g2~~TRINITY_DN2884_c0_g2_i1.p1  ORF type:complete len:363 (+),score=57.18 TRINITY_DN2884_c0_g2_i1:436-1524(+)